MSLSKHFRIKSFSHVHLMNNKNEILRLKCGRYASKILHVFNSIYSSSRKKLVICFH